MRIDERRRRVNKLTENAIVGLLAVFTAASVFADRAQDELEYYLQHGNWERSTTLPLQISSDGSMTATTPRG